MKTLTLYLKDKKTLCGKLQIDDTGKPTATHFNANVIYTKYKEVGTELTVTIRIDYGRRGSTDVYTFEHLEDDTYFLTKMDTNIDRD